MRTKLKCVSKLCIDFWINAQIILNTVLSMRCVGGIMRHNVQLHMVAKTAGMNPVEWMENADRLVAGFLEKFEERCHIMVSQQDNVFCFT